jgi:hypothetical protein
MVVYCYLNCLFGPCWGFFRGSLGDCLEQGFTLALKQPISYKYQPHTRGPLSGPALVRLLVPHRRGCLGAALGLPRNGVAGDRVAADGAARLAARAAHHPLPALLPDAPDVSGVSLLV